MTENPEGTIITDEGAKFKPWTDGHAVGFEVELPDGKVEYIYLNPSTSTGTPGDADVFLYTGPHGSPAEDTTFRHWAFEWEVR